MTRKEQAAKKAQEEKDSEIIIQAFLAQYDALVVGLCDVCCISNYWNSQRTKIRDEARKLSPDALRSIAGIRLFYDTTGLYEEDEDEVLDDKAPLFADSVFFIPYSNAGSDDTFPTLAWDGHLKFELRGHR